jgi:hypothetical protein
MDTVSCRRLQPWSCGASPTARLLGRFDSVVVGCDAAARRQAQHIIMSHGWCYIVTKSLIRRLVGGGDLDAIAAAASRAALGQSAKKAAASELMYTDFF